MFQNVIISNKNVLNIILIVHPLLNSRDIKITSQCIVCTYTHTTATRTTTTQKAKVEI